MTWFKVDDSFYDHPKFIDLPNAAIGLWAKCGAWCGKHLTDGVIPASQVKRFKGTTSQINALVSERIWVEERDESGAKVYRFHDWNEYQPTRKQVLKERQDGAERQRKSRQQKREEQEQRENVTRDSHVTPSRDSHECHKGVSHRPDPTRPDPTFNGGEVASHLSVVDAREHEWPAGEDPLDVLGAATQRARNAGISETAIKAGYAEYDRRPHPKGPGLLRTLINDAWDQERSRAADDNARAARRATIDACDRCDDNGWVIGTNPAVKCNHQPHEEDTPPWEKHA